MRDGVAALCQLISIYLILCHSTAQRSKRNASENLRCFVNYIEYVNCTWNSGSGRGDGPFLLIVKDEDEAGIYYKCTLFKVPHKEYMFSCDITDVFMYENTKFSIEVQDFTTNNTLDMIDLFEPRCNIKMDKPENLSYKDNGSIYTIMCRGYEDFPGVASLQYELQWKEESLEWKDANKKLIFDIEAESNMTMELPAMQIKKAASYDVRVRCKTHDTDDYSSQWSEWSSELKIITAGEEVNIRYIMLVVSFLVIACIVIYLFFTTSLPARLKILLLKEVPTAARFFEPLYVVHHGDFKNWTRHPTACVQKKKEAMPFNPLDLSPNSPNVLSYQEENISPVKVEAPTPTKEAPLILEPHGSDSGFSVLQLRDISLNDLYPSLSFDFPTLEVDENVFLSSSLLSTTDYLSYSYNSAYISNSSEADQ